MRQSKSFVLVVGFAVTGWVGLLGMGLREIKPQSKVEVCPRNQGTYMVFVPHHWGLDYDNLIGLSKFKHWKIIEKCKRYGVRNNLSEFKNSKRTTWVGTQIGPFTNPSDALDALFEIQTLVKGTSYKIGDENSPFLQGSPAGLSL